MVPLDSKCSEARKELMNYLHDETSYLCVCTGAATGDKILYCNLVSSFLDGISDKIILGMYLGQIS